MSDLVVARNCCMAMESFPQKASLCRNEQDCQGAKKDKAL